MNIYRRINFLCHYQNLLGLIVTLSLLGLSSYFIYLANANFYLQIAIVVFGIYSTTSTVLVHRNYYKNDSGKSLVIKGDRIEIKDINNNTTIIKTSEILRVTLTEGLRKNRQQTSWSDYFYLQIELINREPIFLTSLLLTKKIIPFSIDNTINVAYPFVKFYSYEIEKQEYKTKLLEEKQNRINKFKNVYYEYSIAELENILKNKNQYETTAINAATEVLIEKKQLPTNRNKA